jgi:hypothetical protein
LRHELETQNDELIAKDETKQREKQGKGMVLNKKIRALKRDRHQINAEIKIEDEEKKKSEAEGSPNHRKRLKKSSKEEVKDIA